MQISKDEEKIKISFDWCINHTYTMCNGRQKVVSYRSNEMKRTMIAYLEAYKFVYILVHSMYMCTCISICICSIRMSKRKMTELIMLIMIWLMVMMKCVWNWHFIYVPYTIYFNIENHNVRHNLAWRSYLLQAYL